MYLGVDFFLNSHLHPVVFSLKELRTYSLKFFFLAAGVSFFPSCVLFSFRCCSYICEIFNIFLKLSG